MSGNLPGWLTRFVDKWDMPWMVATVLVYLVAVAAVPIVFPDVSGVFIAVLILVGGFTSSVGTLLAAVKADKASKDAKRPETSGHTPRKGGDMTVREALYMKPGRYVWLLDPDGAPVGRTAIARDGNTEPWTATRDCTVVSLQSDTGVIVALNQRRYVGKGQVLTCILNL